MKQSFVKIDIRLNVISNLINIDILHIIFITTSFYMELIWFYNRLTFGSVILCNLDFGGIYGYDEDDVD